MKLKAIAAIIAGSAFLAGCADTSHYPITGNAVGIQDQVKFMSAPEIARY
jgi:hypothetical protein